MSRANEKVVRAATHAGSWYTDSKKQLNAQLDGWLDAVDLPIPCIGQHSRGETLDTAPVRGARMIIAPHAGYSYSGPAAAWAYKSWDISEAKRIFLLGPSHHYYLSGAALSSCTHYATPLGNLPVDRQITASLHASGHFEWMDISVDEEEHSLEMHLPYIYKRLAQQFGDQPVALPPLVPIMIGNTSAATEQALGKLLAPYLANPENAFVISSDFAHWGSRFRYTYYRSNEGRVLNLSSSNKTPKEPPIHESIKAIDFECMAACEGGSHRTWLDKLQETGNTVCGRHPIGVMMAAVEKVRNDRNEPHIGAFKFVRYERSGEVERISDSSVSYCSAIAVI